MGAAAGNLLSTATRREEERSRSMKAVVYISGTHWGEQKTTSTRTENKKKIKEQAEESLGLMNLNIGLGGGVALQSGPIKNTDLQISPGTSWGGNFSLQPLLRNYKAFSGLTNTKPKQNPAHKEGQPRAAQPRRPCRTHPSTQRV